MKEEELSELAARARISEALPLTAAGRSARSSRQASIWNPEAATAAPGAAGGGGGTHAGAREHPVEGQPTARIPWEPGVLRLTHLAPPPGWIPRAIALQEAAIPKQILQGNPCT